ncbi:hypothetical protein CH92_00685 [Stutzerimonas stutzeri]|uniref:DUF2388 domain-containing protein n=1 Tax=Stutzerimonas stutzeri TaxID=316 RepID=W8QTU2_STUST|nr:DUF2388 domain-containing protein [Stutzerimonas stutzeri]AHL73689.1 hypothetical protein CH92_00685 [Stutzerimonas stutzeri]MCQ4328796.1 DUF2388 domain-containing protein [Stutzerimonas stutzeri]
MKLKLLAAPLALTLLTSGAQAQTLVATSNIVINAVDRSINFTSDVTSRISDMKVVSEARDEAAGFVASAGEIRGARLEAAFGGLRSAFPEARHASDQALAELILAQ